MYSIFNVRYNQSLYQIRGNIHKKGKQLINVSLCRYVCAKNGEMFKLFSFVIHLRNMGEKRISLVFTELRFPLMSSSKMSNDDDCNELHQKLVKCSNCLKTKVAPSVPFSAETVIVPNCPRLDEL